MADLLICACVEEFVMCLSVAAGLTTEVSHTPTHTDTQAYLHVHKEINTYTLSLLTDTHSQTSTLTETFLLT